MAGAKRRRAGIPARFWAGVACLAVALSVAVRWSGIGDRLRGEAPPMQVEVLNGTGESGLAMRTAVELRKAGIDVLIVKDAEHFHFERSIIVDRRGDRDLVSRLSGLTGCRRVVEQKQERPLVDVTFVIGRDMSDFSIDR
ncbi:MAG TPA: LytR family transcriptional regulator [Candidatus Eisenbacteria bacterium]|uniref:LytR family transcriptional regulator n=1 Tax=Eiseniibacteriota bacterium TaxID=2212470 RepID=A0A7V2F371_UNCEI|nr:LytR family transcriptional regulator [Candidatus Eisenbacteria bacterium]